MSKNNKTVVIFGATSFLAQRCCKMLAAEGYSLVLVGRNALRLENMENDLIAYGALVSTLVFDLDKLEQHDSLVDKVSSAESFWFFAGSLADQTRCQEDWDYSYSALITNGISPMSLLSRLANVCEARRRGSFVVVSSVAGDRGRQSNYVYGAAKGALSLFCEGLRGRLRKANVTVLVVKPGFFISPMTESVEKRPAILWVDAERVANDIVKAWKSGSDNVYSPWFWRPIMRVIREIPSGIMKKLTL